MQFIYFFFIIIQTKEESIKVRFAKTFKEKKELKEKNVIEKGILFYFLF